MNDAVITSYTLIDFATESDLTAFFVFVEQNYDQLASDLRDNGMMKFYITRVFNKDGKFTCLLYTSPSPRDRTRSRMPSSA